MSRGCPGVGVARLGMPSRTDVYCAPSSCFGTPTWSRTMPQRGKTGSPRVSAQPGREPSATGSQMLRGEVGLTDFDPALGNEAGKRRPTVIVSDGRANATAGARSGRCGSHHQQHHARVPVPGPAAGESHRNPCRLQGASRAGSIRLGGAARASPGPTTSLDHRGTEPSSSAALATAGGVSTSSPSRTR
jgi:hypothetical protein